MKKRRSINFLSTLVPTSFPTCNLGTRAITKSPIFDMSFVIIMHLAIHQSGHRKQQFSPHWVTDRQQATINLLGNKERNDKLTVDSSKNIVFGELFKNSKNSTVSLGADNLVHFPVNAKIST